MAKINKHEPQKPKGEATKTDTGAEKRDALVTPGSSTSAGKGKTGGKGNHSRVGGTAVPGAKTTQPKQVGTTNNPQQQQYESMNRDMRRRMEHLGTGPDQKNSVVDQRRKKLERRRKRLEERRQEVKKVAATGPRKISLGRRNTYFLIAVAVLIVIIIVLAVLVNLRIL